MALRKGELSQARPRREWLHRVALPAAKMRGDIFRDFADARSAPRRTFLMRRDGRDFVVLCFARAEDADSFYGRFGGERLP
jgi:hypothetical protein